MQMKGIQNYDYEELVSVRVLFMKLVSFANELKMVIKSH